MSMQVFVTTLQISAVQYSSDVEIQKIAFYVI